MAVVLGTSSGFVTSAPVDNPQGINSPIGGYARGQKDTSPVTNNTITEIGFYANNATSEANFEIGIYSHNAGDDKPNVRLYHGTTNAKGTGAGWISVTGLNYTITPETIYWLAVVVDDSSTNTDYSDAARGCYKETADLLNPFGSDGEGFYTYAIYAITSYVEPPVGSTEGQSMPPYVY